MGKKLVFLGADFSANCIDDGPVPPPPPTPSELFAEQFAQAVVLYHVIWATAEGLSKLNASNSRCIVAIPKEAAIDTPIIITGTAVAANTYSFIEVPEGARTVKYTHTNATYQIGVGYVHGSSWVGGAFWASAGSENTLDLTGYPGENVWIVVTVKKTNNSNFTAQFTVQDLGLSITVE